MGVDVASFGDFFADMRPVDAQSRAVSRVIKTPVSGESNPKTLDHTTEVTAQPAVHILIDDSTNNTNGSAPQAKSIPLKKRGQKHDQPIKSLVYKDPFDSTYKKYIFTADGKYLLGGMMIGDVADYVKLVAIVKKKVWTPFYQVLLIHLPDFVSQKAIEVAPSQFIVGAKKSGDDAGDDLDDDAQVCSCHVSFFVYFFSFGRLMALIFMVERLEGQIGQCIKEGVCTTIGDLKVKTKVGTGCGGCMPLVSCTSFLAPSIPNAFARLPTFSILR